MENFHFGKNLKRIRDEKRIKQDVMATEIHMSQPTLSKIESESSVPHDKFITDAAKYLKVPRRDLLPPSWFTETVKRKVYVLTVTGHIFYIFFIAGFIWQGIHDIPYWLERTAAEKIMLVSVFALAAIAFYYFTVRKIEITEYL